MKSGVPGQDVRRQARETAREAARQSGMSVGEWLDTVITDSALDESVAPPSPARSRHEEHEYTARDPRPARRAHPDYEGHRFAGHAEPIRPAIDEGLVEVNDRLDNLTGQLERIAQLNAANAQAPRSAAQDVEAARQFAQIMTKLDRRLDQLAAENRSAKEEIEQRVNAVDRAVAELAHRPPRPSLPAGNAATPLDQALLEIADRQRALDGYPATPAAAPRAPAPAPSEPLPRAPTQEFSRLEQQLRQINSQIETLNRPCGLDQAVNKAVDLLRDDLAEIGVMLQDAMPRKAVEALEGEMRKLAERIDHNRQAGADGAALAGLERGLGEVRDALRALTPAENLAGLDDAVKGLSKKIDSIAGNSQDPATLKQLEGAIVTMRGIVSHVASNDALATLAEEVRALTRKVDQASSSVGADMLSNLERRIETLADALAARNQNGQEVPRELDTVVKGLIDKIERIQVTRGDDGALSHLEGRIATLVEKLDASDSRLNHLEAIERGLAELLIHIEHNRLPQLARPVEASAPPARFEALQRDLAVLQETERKNQDSLEAVHGTLGDVVGRLAMIETDIRAHAENAIVATAKAVIASAAPAAQKVAEEPDPAEPAAPLPTTTLPPAPTLMTEAPEPIEFPADPPQPKAPPPAAVERRPIDPSLPPDHPLEPGALRARHASSPAERIAASEAALGPAKPPVIPDPGGKSNFIAAARRAAQAAAMDHAPRNEGRTADPAAPKEGTLAGLFRRHARALIIGISVLVIVLGSLKIAASWLASADESEHAVPGQTATSAPLDTHADAPAEPVIAAPAAPAAPTTPTASAPAAPATAIEAPATPPPSGRQSSFLPLPGDTPIAGQIARAIEPGVTGLVAPAEQSTPPSVPAAHAPAPAAQVPAAAHAQAVTAPAAPAASTNGADKLPAAITGPLRMAAIKGDPAAQFEIAQRFADGRGVAQNMTEAAEWFERAAKQGLVLAQFRLGGLYEKGVGVKKNIDTARRLYLAAGEAGNAKALHNLAVLYSEGVDGKPDYQSAAQWFRKAAVYGIADSQYNLGILYARGIGVEQNLAEAYRWFALAARDGDRESAKKRDDVAARLDGQSLRNAQQAVDAFTPAPQPEAATQVKTPHGGWDAAVSPVSVVTPAGKRKPAGPKFELSIPRPTQ